MATDDTRSSRSVSFDVLLRYNELETARWRDWFGKQPDGVLDITVGDAALGMGKTRDLLFLFWKGVLAVVLWPYYLGLHFSVLMH